MPFEKVSEHLNGVVVIRTQEFFDERGSFMEMYRSDQLIKFGIPAHFQQENYSFSKKGVLRGLHFQWEPQMGKLMRVISGRAFLVSVDIRKNSPTFGQWFGLDTSHNDRLQIWAPPGFARGFCALSHSTEIQYLCSGLYNSECESGIRWNDENLNIQWPVDDPILSPKDKNAQTLDNWLKNPNSDIFRV